MADTVTVRIPLAIRKRCGRKVVVSPDGSVLPTTPRHMATNADPALLKALGRAFRWKRLLDDGTCASVSDIARADKLARPYVGDILRLTLLAPEPTCSCVRFTAYRQMCRTCAAEVHWSASHYSTGSHSSNWGPPLTLHSGTCWVSSAKIKSHSPVHQKTRIGEARYG